MESLTDEQLYAVCRQYGEEARLARQKFLGLLPEVYRRSLYKKKGFGSIFEFGAKLGGASREQVKRVLSLNDKFSKAPQLQTLLMSGEVSMHKLARVAAVATKEDQDFWVDQVKALPKKAIETLVRDMRQNQASQNVVPGHKSKTKPLTLDEDVQRDLANLQEKGIDVNELIRSALKNRKQEIEQEKQTITEELKPTRSRYIPKKVNDVLKKEHGDKCSMDTCSRKSEVRHHTQRFSLARTHDPRFIAPLCKEHHTIAHGIDRNYRTARKKLSGT